MTNTRTIYGGMLHFRAPAEASHEHPRTRQINQTIETALRVRPQGSKKNDKNREKSIWVWKQITTIKDSRSIARSQV